MGLKQKLDSDILYLILDVSSTFLSLERDRLGISLSSVLRGKKLQTLEQTS